MLTNLIGNIYPTHSFQVRDSFFSIISSLRQISTDTFQYTLLKIGDSPITLANLIGVIMIMTAAFLISKYLRKSLTHLSKTKTNISESALFTVAKIVHYIIIVIATLISFTTLGIDFSKLALVAGALSVGIGFGLQSIFNNFISGLILLFERPLKVGDLIQLESGVRGRIKSINVRSTQITTWDNIDILVPNSEFISGRVTNYTFNDDLRRIHIAFGVAYGSDKELVKKAAMGAALRVPYTITTTEKLPDVWLTNFGESSLDFELVVWVQGDLIPKNKNPKSIYLWELETSLNQYAIEIPFPQRDLHIKNIDNETIKNFTSHSTNTKKATITTKE